MSIRNIKKQNYIQLLLVLTIIIVVNILSSFIFTRIDLTQEKRYTLSESSIKLAENLEDVIYFKIYLEGDLPPGFKRLRNSLNEFLDEYRIYSGDNIEYEFIDPSANPDNKAKLDLYRQLSGKGLIPTNLEQKDQSGQSQKIIFPGAIVSYRSLEYPMQVLKSRMGSSPEQMLNNSIETLEYEISSMLRKITNEDKLLVGLLRGQKEIQLQKLNDASISLAEFYQIDTVAVDGKLDALKDFDAIIVAGPDTSFSEKDKFIIDQFIMRGGKVLWLIDKMQINMDSLTASSTNIAISNDLNLDDMFFRYGVRINADLLLDLQSAPIPIVTGYVGNQPKQQLFPWYYFPLLQTDNRHPIIHNLNNIKAEFVSSIDTIENPEIKKTVLLNTSKFTRIQTSPARVSLNMLRDEPDPGLFNKRHIPVAVLLEGNFTSNYHNRIPEQLASSPEINFKSRSDTTSMIVISDGDMIANFVSKKGNVFPLGYDRYTGQYYGNKNFILNCIDYLCGNKGILSLRGKEFKLRLLDSSKNHLHAGIQLINVIVPAVIIIIFGIVYNIIRKRKYQR